MVVGQDTTCIRIGTGYTLQLSPMELPSLLDDYADDINSYIIVALSEGVHPFVNTALAIVHVCVVGSTFIAVVRGSHTTTFDIEPPSDIGAIPSNHPLPSFTNKWLRQVAVAFTWRRHRMDSSLTAHSNRARPS